MRRRAKTGNLLAAVWRECRGKLGARGDLELAVSAAQVVRDRLGGDEQSLRDRAVGESFGSRPGDSQLRPGERVERLRSGWRNPAPGGARSACCGVIARPSDSWRRPFASVAVASIVELPSPCL